MTMLILLGLFAGGGYLAAKLGGTGLTGQVGGHLLRRLLK